MNIRPNQLFRHGRASLAPGADYDVPDALGTYFKMNGWADDSPAGIDPARVVKMSDAEFEIAAPRPKPGAALDVHDGSAKGE